jgi:O-antigen/teichoic acid export membrane protein
MVLPKFFNKNPLLQSIYFPDAKVNYVFVSNLLASAFTFLVFIPKYWLAKGNFDWTLWKKMIRYGLPILLAGIAFAVNEHLDKILLEKLHVPMAQIGSYSACYKIGVFMVLYRTAFTLGIEPFFFSQAKEKNAPETYANVTKYFVIFGSIITYVVILFSDILKPFLIRNESYWDAMMVVPIIVIANFFLGIYTNLSVWYKVIDKTWIGALISLLGALCTLLINWWTIPVLGYVGSALATIGAYGSMMLLSYVWGQKKYPIPYDWKTMGMYLLLAFSGSLVYFYGYRENYWIGFGILLVLLTYTFYQQKEFLQKMIPTWKK